MPDINPDAGYIDKYPAGYWFDIKPEMKKVEYPVQPLFFYIKFLIKHLNKPYFVNMVDNLMATNFWFLKPE